MPDLLGALRRLVTRDELRPAANEAAVLRVLAEHGPELSPHRIGMHAGFPPGRAYQVVARLYAAGKVTSRWSDDHKRVVYRLTEQPTTAGRHHRDES